MLVLFLASEVRVKMLMSALIMMLMFVRNAQNSRLYALRPRLFVSYAAGRGSP